MTAPPTTPTTSTTALRPGSRGEISDALASRLRAMRALQIAAAGVLVAAGALGAGPIPFVVAAVFHLVANVVADRTIAGLIRLAEVATAFPPPALPETEQAIPIPPTRPALSPPPPSSLVRCSPGCVLCEHDRFMGKRPRHQPVPPPPALESSPS